MPKLTIDGIDVEVEDGLNLIQAAAEIGIEVPHFCYHPDLSIVAQCRQCLVEVEGVPKVLPACNTFVRDGLVVKTNTEKAIEAGRQIIVKGHSPFIPHLFHYVQYAYEITEGNGIGAYPTRNIVTSFET